MLDFVELCGATQAPGESAGQTRSHIVGIGLHSSIGKNAALAQDTVTLGDGSATLSPQTAGNNHGEHAVCIQIDRC